MRQASFKCETPQLELKRPRSCLAIKRCQRTKSKKVINSLIAIGRHDGQRKNELRARVVFPRIFVCFWCVIARKLAVLFGFNRGIRLFYAARRFDELSRGSVSCLLNASFEKQFHNSTTRFFTPKSMTMASAGAIRGEYSPYGGIQWRLGYP